ncbi:MAG: DNA polymerase III subunit delta [Eubacteriales bacterium]|nr:DNA polymerase III subunit delta [Eubacteriales bacterium]
MLVGELKDKLRSTKICGAYIFCGEEDYLKSYYLKTIRDKVITDDATAPFNHVKFPAESCDFGAMLDAIESPPFMSDFKLVEWDYPNLNALKEKDVDALTDLAQRCSSAEYAVMVIICSSDGFDMGTLPKRPSKLYSKLSSAFSIVNFEHSDDKRLCDWIISHFTHEKIIADRDCAKIMVERIGHSMEILCGEIDKLCSYLKENGRNTLCADDIFSVTCANFEGESFGLTNAIMNKDRDLALADIKDRKMRKSDPIVTLGTVCRLFSDLAVISCLIDDGLTQTEIASKMKLHEYKAGLYIKTAKKYSQKQLFYALDKCSELDIISKTGRGDVWSSLERLLCEFFLSR